MNGFSPFLVRRLSKIDNLIHLITILKYILRENGFMHVKIGTRFQI